MLSKKRKFTPTEYENWAPTSGHTEANNASNGQGVSHSQHPPEAHQSSSSSRPQEQQVVYQQQHQHDGEDEEVAINLVRSEVEGPQARPQLDLTEWVGHRVLARRDQV